jgi:hypothetical protein
MGGIIILHGVGSECAGMACMACMRRMHAVRGNLEAARQAHGCEERSREDLHELTAALRRQSASAWWLRRNGHCLGNLFFLLFSHKNRVFIFLRQVKSSISSLTRLNHCNKHAASLQ